MRPRTRTIKPEIFADEVLGDLELKTGLPVFRVFVGLWCIADREGRFEWSPRALRGVILPCWEGDMTAALEALASKSYIVRYTVNGKDYGYIRTFKRHQPIHKNEAPSMLPDPEAHGVELSLPVITGNAPEVPGNSRECTVSSTSTSTSTSASASACEPFAPPALEQPQAPVAVPKPKTERKRSATRMPDDLAPNAGCRALAQELGVSLRVEFPKFVDHHTAKGSLFSDWQAALRTWIRNSVRFGPPPRAAPNDAIAAQAARIRMLREQENQGDSP